MPGDMKTELFNCVIWSATYKEYKNKHLGLCSSISHFGQNAAGEGVGLTQFLQRAAMLALQAL